jgi:dissimilatory sulfite reductase (desulfoviridin) alpha/beta subunit
MIRVIKIGDILLDNPLFYKETFEVKNVTAKSFLSLSGNSVIFERYKKNNTNTITLESGDSGWISEETLKKIYSLANELGIEVPLYTKEGLLTNVRFKTEEERVIEYEQIFEGSKWYKVIIRMAFV